MSCVFIHCNALCIHNIMLIRTVNFELLFDDVETMRLLQLSTRLLLLETIYMNTNICLNVNYLIVELRYKYASK